MPRGVFESLPRLAQIELRDNLLQAAGHGKSMGNMVNIWDYSYDDMDFLGNFWGVCIYIYYINIYIYIENCMIIWINDGISQPFLWEICGEPATCMEHSDLTITDHHFRIG